MQHRDVAGFERGCHNRDASIRATEYRLISQVNAELLEFPDALGNTKGLLSRGPQTNGSPGLTSPVPRFALRRSGS